jgi:hypothetical protein
MGIRIGYNQIHRIISSQTGVSCPPSQHDIADDGNGMDIYNLHRFFDLKNSQVKKLIGEKGLGAKTYFKSDYYSDNSGCEQKTISRCGRTVE